MNDYAVRFVHDDDAFMDAANDAVQRLSVRISAETNSFLEERIKEAFSKGFDLVYEVKFYAASPMHYQAAVDYTFRLPGAVDVKSLAPGQYLVRFEDIEVALRKVSLNLGSSSPLPPK